MTPARAGEDTPWPVELRFRRGGSCLAVTFDDGFAAEIPSELLRVESPSAETRGHGSERPPPPSGKRHVRVTGAETVGRYAVRLRFSDGHDTGLYSWSFLYELAQAAPDRLAAYVDRLERSGGSRG
jgi:DUF971 family protein